ncbi:MAG: sugar phosphate isomerase/epimerase [Lentisphaerae bacterium]|jgi:sugar phosphate isomerase/epimerase|nr:sugar phosphate isomerase/epimerase [Lentisphaerota bacterium]
MKLSLSELVHAGVWNGIPENYYDFLMAEWAAHGVTRLIFCSTEMARGVREPEFGTAFIKRAAEHGLRWSDGHVPWNPEWALNTPEPYRETMIRNNTRALELAAEAGCTTLTIHIGDIVCLEDTYLPLGQARDLLDDALERLIPVAERSRVVLCIENIMAPTDTPAELIRCFERFQSPFFGCCYDSGHDNLMAARPGKEPHQLNSWTTKLWRGKPQLNPDDALATLLPHIVTCHLHDNNGLEDQHLPPGQGTVDWPRTLDLLSRAPRLISVQNELSFTRKPGVSIPAAIEAFRRIGFEE